MWSCDEHLTWTGMVDSLVGLTPQPIFSHCLWADSIQVGQAAGLQRTMGWVGEPPPRTHIVTGDQNLVHLSTWLEDTKLRKT